MSSPAVQLSFTLRTSPNARTVHLLGSWDDYKSQLPLSKAKDHSAKPGSWKGTFRFQGSTALKLGSRYWYYYIVDGYHVSHDPAKEFETEKTTGRKLNVIDVPGGDTNDSKPQRPTVNTNRHFRDIPQGRALSPGKIQHPKPSKPHASRQLREADYDGPSVDDLAEQFTAYSISSDRRSSSPSELSVISSSSDTVLPSSNTSSNTSPGTSRASSVSDYSCRCERYGVTRSGQRIKLDCGGERCSGWSSSASECDSDTPEEDSSDDELEYHIQINREMDMKRGLLPHQKTTIYTCPKRREK